MNETPLSSRQREALVAKLAESLDDAGSWCGETHLQKATYFLETMLGVPLGFGHVLYKYGPFSFEFRDELAVMESDGFIRERPTGGYGPQLEVTESASKHLIDTHAVTLQKYGQQIEFVATKFGSKGVGELEVLATSLWALCLEKDASNQALAEKVNDFKPHVDIPKAFSAVRLVREWQKEAEALA